LIVREGAVTSPEVVRVPPATFNMKAPFETVDAPKLTAVELSLTVIPLPELMEIVLAVVVIPLAARVLRSLAPRVSVVTPVRAGSELRVPTALIVSVAGNFAGRVDPPRVMAPSEVFPTCAALLVDKLKEPVAAGERVAAPKARSPPLTVTFVPPVIVLSVAVPPTFTFRFLVPRAMGPEVELKLPAEDAGLDMKAKLKVPVLLVPVPDTLRGVSTVIEPVSEVVPICNVPAVIRAKLLVLTLNAAAVPPVVSTAMLEAVPEGCGASITVPVPAVNLPANSTPATVAAGVKIDSVELVVEIVPEI
jgi:hypothetical protein